MRILVGARHPGAAEAVGPVVYELMRRGHDILLIGVDGNSQQAKTAGGSAAVFEGQGLQHTALSELGYAGHPARVPERLGRSLIHLYRPDRILVGCSTYIPGDELGIEEVLIAAGALSSSVVVHIVESWGNWTHREDVPMASSYAVLDSLSAKIMAARGVPEEEITVTGHPGLDSFARPSVHLRSDELRESLGLSGNRAVVFYGQSWETGSAIEAHTALAWVVDSLQPRDRLIFARHPRDPRDYASVLSRAGAHILESDLDSHQLLSVADVSITQNSTMGLKSALLDIPTINVLHEDDEPQMQMLCGGFPLTVLDGNYEVNSQAEMGRLLSGDLNGKGLKLRKALGVDGDAASRVADLVVR